MCIIYHPTSESLLCRANLFGSMSDTICCSYLSYFLMFGMQLVLLVGTKLQHVIATLALESAGITGLITGTKLKPRDELFWFKKPQLLLTLIHFILFQVGYACHDAFFMCSVKICWSFHFNKVFNKTLILMLFIYFAECI